ncbi:MAG: hypothetical protein HYR55_06585 [Acidobacteria bacterium]|nr:hypothetical protein [Acidobacteriota bacterium]MBI3656876.1 hypothetical protein [Acidobacteriota bacterium]
MDESRLKPRKSQSFRVVRCEVCGTEVVIDKARGVQCPKCGAGRQAPTIVPQVEDRPKIEKPVETSGHVPAEDTPERMPSRRIQSWRSSISDLGRKAPRSGDRPSADSRSSRPVERESRPEGRPRQGRPPERPSDRSYERGHGPVANRSHERSTERPSYRPPAHGSNRPNDRGLPRDRGNERGSYRSGPPNQAPRFPRAERRPTAPEVPGNLKREVLAAWGALRQKEERPPEGRRVKLANQFGLTFDQVTAIIKEQPRERPRPPKPTSRPKPVDPMVTMDPVQRRDIGFQIEKAYFVELLSGETKRPWKIMVRAVARRASKPEGMVASWIQMLHRKSKRMVRTQKPDDATSSKILEAYQGYLQADKPPELSLHKALAAELGAKQRQIHRVLYEYRWRLRNNAVTGGPGQMVLESPHEPISSPVPQDVAGSQETQPSPKP